jgi:hypothetical protein
MSLGAEHHSNLVLDGLLLDDVMLASALSPA